MKKSKLIFYFIIGFIIIWASIYASITYVTKYKKNVCDTSTAPDSQYTLTLLSLGEPEWPQGVADGRLILENTAGKISQIDFELRNNGGNVNKNCWKVNWQKNYVEIVISGSEQFDEEILLYFDGKTDRKQLIN